MLTKRQVEIFLQFCEHENEYLKAGDVTGDGKVDIQDILKINKYRLNKIGKILIINP